MQANLRLSLRPSRRLAALLLALHVCALAALWPPTLPLWARMVLGAAVVASLTMGLRHSALLQSPDAATELDCGADGRVEIVRRDGVCLAAEVLPATAIYGAAVLLRLKAAGERRPRSIVVLPDSLGPEDFRRLRVWLRWKLPTGA